MKIRQLYPIVLVLLSFGGSTLYSQQFALGGGLAYATENDNVKGAPGFELTFVYLTESPLAVRASAGRYASNVKVDLLSEGDYALTWLEGTLLARLKYSTVEPYAGVGIG